MIPVGAAHPSGIDDRPATDPIRMEDREMKVRTALTAGPLMLALAVTVAAQGAEKECDRWLKLVDREVGERKEALAKKTGAERARIQASLASVAGKIAEAREACKAGKDKAATSMALDLWDAFVEEERREAVLSLNSRLTILELRLGSLKAFHRRGWKPQRSAEAERRFASELDRFDKVLADALKEALR
jgi:hypothetical protein